MKFSILLPTRNRLELLKFAVQSVLDQDYQDWEIVISDNASADDVAGFVRDLKDSRIRYLRSDTLLPVTENWNRALYSSNGEFFIMLGDDDCLLRGCLSVAAALLKEYEEPQLIYTEAIQFAYPNVLPDIPKGFVQYGYCEFLKGKTAPFILGRETALAAVSQSACFRIAYSYNMQHSIVSRKFADELSAKGPFFQSPYPDYYATNALFLAARRILVCPWPLVGIGISPKSFGFFYFNSRETEGTEFLQNLADPVILERISDKVVPGSNMNTSWLLAMETLKKNYPEGAALKIKYQRYRFMQFRHLMGASDSPAEFRRLLRQFGTLGERLFWGGILMTDAIISIFLPNKIRAKILNRCLGIFHTSHPRFGARKRTVDYENLLQLSRNEGGVKDIPLEWRNRLGINV